MSQNTADHHEMFKVLIIKGVAYQQVLAVCIHMLTEPEMLFPLAHHRSEPYSYQCFIVARS